MVVSQNCLIFSNMGGKSLFKVGLKSFEILMEEGGMFSTLEFTKEEDSIFILFSRAEVEYVGS